MSIKHTQIQARLIKTHYLGIHHTMQQYKQTQVMLVIFVLDKLFDWKPNLVLIVASTLEHSYENWAILSMIDVNSTYKNKKVMIPYGIVNYSYDDGIIPNFFIKYSASKLYWYYTGNWASSIVCNNANTLYYYIAFP